MGDFTVCKLSNFKHGVSCVQNKHHGYDVQSQKAMIDGTCCLLCCCIVHERSLRACRFGDPVHPSFDGPDICILELANCNHHHVEVSNSCVQHSGDNLTIRILFLAPQV